MYKAINMSVLRCIKAWELKDAAYIYIYAYYEIVKSNACPHCVHSDFLHTVICLACTRFLGLSMLVNCRYNVIGSYLL